MNLPLLFLLERLELNIDPALVPHDACVNAVFLLEDGFFDVGTHETRLGALPGQGTLGPGASALFIGSWRPAQPHRGSDLPDLPDDAYFLLDASTEAGELPNGQNGKIVTARFDVGLTFNRAIGICFAYQRWHERFSLLLQDAGNANQLMRECSKLFGNAAYMVDPSFKVMAIDDSPLFSEISFIWKHLVEEGYLLYDIVYSMHKSSELEQMTIGDNAMLCESDNFNNPFINYNLSAGGLTLGHFFVVGYQKRITAGELTLANLIGAELARFVEQFGLSRTNRAAHEGFVMRLMEGTPMSRDVIARQIAPQGWALSDTLCVIAVSDKAGGAPLHDVLAKQIEHSFEALMASSTDMVIGLVNADRSNAGDPQRFRSRLERFARKHGCIMGLSDFSEGFDAIGAQFRQAKMALSHAAQTSDTPSLPGQSTKTGAASGGSTCRSFGESFLGCLAEYLEGEGKADDFVDRRVSALVASDAARNTEYARTLEAYLRNDRKLNDTARELFVHRNTLLYRIGRLKETFGTDLDSPDQRQRILLSLAALKR